MDLTGMRIGLLTAFASREGGGVFEAVVAQAAMISAAGGTPIIFALRDSHAEADRHRFEGASVVLSEVVGPRQIGFAPGLLTALKAASLDCLHLHGIWMYPSWAGAAWARASGKAYFISPHGMLDPWITARGRWKKALARLVYERRGWMRATSLHGLTPREAQDIARETGRSDTIVIPNAGPPASPVHRDRMPDPIVVYIGRIHPKKNLEALIGGWAGAQRPEGARLVIAGWGDAASVNALQANVAAGDGSVSFAGPVFGAEKQRLLAAARFVILPSHSEGLPMAMLEAWAAGIPTIMTAECNLPDGFTSGAALECGYAADAIASALGLALTLDAAAWGTMSAAARALAAGPFSERAVSSRWATVYARAGTPDRRTVAEADLP